MEERRQHSRSMTISVQRQQSARLVKTSSLQTDRQTGAWPETSPPQTAINSKEENTTSQSMIVATSSFNPEMQPAKEEIYIAAEPMPQPQQQPQSTKQQELKARLAALREKQLI
jgi:hypothetical protein